MRNNAAYLPESPIVYIILPKSIRNRASFAIFVSNQGANDGTAIISAIVVVIALFITCSAIKQNNS